METGEAAGTVGREVSGGSVVGVPEGEAPVAEPIDGRTPCPDCGRRFQPRGLAAHRRQAHGVVRVPEPAAPLPAPDLAALDFGPLTRALEEVLTRLTRLDTRVGRMEAALVGNGERRSRSRERAEDVAELAAELQRLLTDIAETARALGAGEDPELRRRLGALRQAQAAVLFRMGPDAPGGAFPAGDNLLGQR